MYIVIASNRPLPIRYDPAHNIWFNKGIISPPDITLPFFVEVTVKGKYDGIYMYVEEMLQQYKNYEIQLFCEQIGFLNRFEQLFPFSEKNGSLIIIKK